MIMNEKVVLGKKLAYGFNGMQALLIIIELGGKASIMSGR